MSSVKSILRNLINPLRKNRPDTLQIQWIRNNPSWLSSHVKKSQVILPKFPLMTQIQNSIQESKLLGKLPLWEGYENLENYPTSTKNATRSVSQVSTGEMTGRFFYHLVCVKKPVTIVEFGTAFGVSGMYWLAGVEQNNTGELLTFEPNSIWAEIAQKNLSSIGTRFRLVVGTFEDYIDHSLKENQKIDLAFIDAIHTSEFVFHQFDLVVARSSPNAIIVLDDINFSEDMTSAWETLANDDRVKASLAVSKRVGVIELK